MGIREVSSQTLKAGAQATAPGGRSQGDLRAFLAGREIPMTWGS